MLRIGTRIDPKTGHVASPDALCAALGVSRRTYDNVVARFQPQDGRRRKEPRVLKRGSDTARMLAALRTAGDVRFVPSTPSTQEAA